MPARAHWKGYLKLSLVSCPIALHPAVSPAERVSFRQVNRETGNRLRQQMVDTVTGEVVDSAGKGRGYQVGQNQFLMVEDAELEAAHEQARQKPFGSPAESGPKEPAREVKPISTAATSRGTLQKQKAGSEPPPMEEVPIPIPPPIRVENNHTIEIERCLPVGTIDARYHQTSYYITPRDEVGVETFVVIRDAMDKKGLVGLGHVVLSKRERPILVMPFYKGLCGITLRYSHEIRDAQDYFDRIPDVTLPAETLEVAQHILEMKIADFDPAVLEDRYRTVLVSMLRRKQAALPVPASPAPLSSSRNVIDLMEALKRSLAADQASARPPAKSMLRRSPPGRSEDQVSKRRSSKRRR